MKNKPHGFQRIQSGLNENAQQPNQATPEEAATIERFRVKFALADEYQRGFEAGLAAAQEAIET
ncbi:MAG: hypothetical protein ACRBBW_19855 [Cellvibrionaceae bacterium]